MGKLINGIVATATSAVLTVTGVNFAHNEKNTDSNNNYCVVQQNICPRIRDCVEWAIGIANDPSHGYDQNDRWGPDSYDCSSMVLLAFRDAGGIDIGGATYTGNMCSELKDKGFSVYDFNYSQLQYGDIILWHDYSANNGHVELYIGNNQLVGAHINEKGEITGGEPGDQTENEISVGPYYDSDWQYILRYTPKPLDWLQIPDYDDDFYAFIESDNTVLAFDNDILFMEKETGNSKEIFHFVKEKKNCFTISNGSYSGSYNLYQDENGAVILHEVGSESSCLTSVFGTVISTEYDSCSDEQRFRIRPVSDPNAIINGSVKPTAEEDMPSGHGAGQGRHDSDGREETESPTEEQREIVVEQQNYSAPLYNEPESEPAPPPTPEPVYATQVTLTRNEKMLSTKGGSTSFNLSGTVFPTNCVNPVITYSSSNESVAKVDPYTGQVTAVSDGVATITGSTGTAYGVCVVTVATQYQNVTESVPVTVYDNIVESYDMISCCTRIAATHERMYSNKSVNGDYSGGLDSGYGEYVYRWTYSKEEVENAQRVTKGEKISGEQTGVNTVDEIGYCLVYGPYSYIFYIEKVNYKRVPRTTYESVIKQIPIEYP